MIQSTFPSFKKLTRLSVLIASVYFIDVTHAATVSESDFLSPPDSAKPRVWWHWMNGNVTKEGIKQDLEWMNRVGIGGVQNFDAELLTPSVVENPVVYMQKDWAELFSYAVDKANKQGFEFAIAASPGWSETGGPWVKPADGMKKITWSETVVEGGKPVGKKLPAPFKDTGVFQDFGMAPEMFAHHSDKAIPEHYKDIAVLAYRLDSSNNDIKTPRVSASSEIKQAKHLFDGSLKTSSIIESSEIGQAPWIQLDYPQATTISSVSLGLLPSAMFMSAGLAPFLELSEDGTLFKKIASIPVGSNPQYTVSFPSFSAKSLRIVFDKSTGGSFKLPSSMAPGAVAPMEIRDSEKQTKSKVTVLAVNVSAEAKVHRFEEKAGFAIAGNYYAINDSRQLKGVPINTIIDLTDKLKKDGSIDWTSAKGRWRLIRLGSSLLGKENHPATGEATGLEVDKYDDEAVRRYINQYLDNYVDATGLDIFGPKGISALLNDSIEVGPSNWTRNMFTEFKTRRGYDLKPWLAALTGVIIEDTSKTDAFLYDFRRTLAQMLSDNHYATITQELHKRGLTHYSEALENGRPTLGDDMAMRKNADIPMAAMWTFDHNKNVGPMPQYWADIRGAASVAHIYGQNLVAAESLTSAVSPWAFAPKDLQPMIDMEFALGVNRPIIHTSVHQPLSDKAPGFSLFIFGQYFNRLDTWAEYAKPWVTYLSRNAYLLQQGRFVADVAYFYGEETPLTQLYNDKPSTDVPTEHGFDYVNADVILHELKNDGNDVVTASGARYKVIYLGGTSEYMTLPVLTRLAELVRGGATLIGNKPIGTPALMDDKDAFSQLAGQLWSGNVAKGRVIVSSDIKAALSRLDIPADFSYTKAFDDSTLMFVHRKTADEDLYFYTNRKAHKETLEMRFRITGKKPMHWDAASGDITPLSYRVEGEHTVIPKKLRAFESGYIVFADKTTKKQLTIAPVTSKKLITLSGEWDVSFQSERGAPGGVQSLSLGDWAEHENKGINYFSGTANYKKTLDVKKAWLKSGAKLQLDLGDVAELAEVMVNGKSAGIAWKKPFVLEVTDLLKPGENHLEVKVTNLWVNRLIGDKQKDNKKKYTFTTIDTYFPDAPLRASGLLGPVVLSKVN
ncbi:MAG: hypothetical protein JKY66_06845 [Spongiibacteraceae bacterium]|nr:hypothetical protein [Spongiibacteraceae bacterium]